MKKYNIFGFDKGKDLNYGLYRHCTYHAGSRLIPSIDFPDMLLCTQCGSLYPYDYTLADTQITSKFTPRSTSNRPVNILTGQIIKRRFEDAHGNPINISDKDIMNDIKEGRKIMYYKEQKPKGKTKYSY